jgi:hypothetical protein
VRQRNGISQMIKSGPSVMKSSYNFNRDAKEGCRSNVKLDPIDHNLDNKFMSLKANLENKILQQQHETRAQ